MAKSETVDTGVLVVVDEVWLSGTVALIDSDELIGVISWNELAR